MAIVEVHNVSKIYPERMGARAILGRGGLHDWIRGKKDGVFKALDDISLTVDPGESLGIIGRNGSGKSTLLKILAGVTLPSTGSVTLTGRVASLLELGAGFHPMLTGRENIYLNADLLGMHPKDVDKVFDQILAFSGIGDFVDQPVDTYSSGMYVRIAFSVAVHTNPDIFLVDEVLAVGDEEFQRSCRKKIGELKEQGKTIIFVSHDLGIVNTLCDRVMLLNKGKMLSRGSTQNTINYYLRQVGLEKGVHSLSQDGYEVVFSNGRISLFHDQKEVTAPEGLKMIAQAFGQMHDSTAAEWQVTEASDTHCIAEGTMTRIPIRYRWEIVLEQGRVQWSVQVQADSDVPMEYLAGWLFLPSHMESFMLGSYEGSFHPIQPGDMTWSHINTLDCHHDALTLHGSDAEENLVTLNFYKVADAFRLELYNSDYMTGARVAGPIWRFPPHEATLPAGTHDVFSLGVDLSQPGNALEGIQHAARAKQSLNMGDTTFSFHQGEVQLRKQGTLLSSSVHLHTQMLVEGLWCMSHALVWGPVQRDGDTITVAGKSLRFPVVEHWTLSPSSQGMSFEVALEVSRPFSAMEYNVSLGLDPAYMQWKFEEAFGEFPAFEEDNEDWLHINTQYEQCHRIAAAGPTMPGITLQIDTPEQGMHMTAINTGFTQNARVLQAIAMPSQSGIMHFESGTHCLFKGTIAILDE